MNINPYYGVMAGGGSAPPHFAAFPFAQCSDAGFGSGSDFYAKHYHPQNGAVHQLVKHSALLPAASVANGNSNSAVVDGASSENGLYIGRDSNGKLAAYGDTIHAMHVGSPPPGYPAAYGGRGDLAGTYRPGDDHAALTPSPHRPHQGMPPLVVEMKSDL